MLVRLLQLCAAASAATATNLFVSDYSGNITTLSLTAHDGQYQLHSTHLNNGCAPNPSWLTLDSSHGTLYCMDEGLEVANGSLSSYSIGSDGGLTLVHRESTISGPVSGVVFGDPGGRRAIALAHYTGSAISTFNLLPPSNANTTSTFTPNQNIPFHLKTPGPNPSRQDSPHEHQAILDPTSTYLLFPDLGADLIRIFSFSPLTNELIPEEPLAVVPGSGPRHAVFYTPSDGGGVSDEGDATFLFVVTELANTVTSYRVEYPVTGGMRFSQVYNSSVYGELDLPVGNAAAGITISPDNRFLIISNRNDTSFTIPAPPPPATAPMSPSPHNNKPTTNKKIPSDSISTFSLHPNGSLSFLQLWPAGGRYPRHFSLNNHGDLVAVGLQYDDAVVVMRRDVRSGFLGRPVARVEVGGNVTCVRWDE